MAILVCAFGICTAQKKLFGETGVINFTSVAELELIKASSNGMRGLIDSATQRFAFNVDISSFRGFNSDLQRGHFMENYMETDKYPKASFTGKIIEEVDFTKPGTYEVRAKGDLDIHGVKQTRIIKGTLTITKTGAQVDASFKVPLADHNISIPKIVNQKIATEIEVAIRALMTWQP